VAAITGRRASHLSKKAGQENLSGFFTHAVSVGSRMIY
jgi:hypothetical protein